MRRARLGLLVSSWVLGVSLSSTPASAQPKAPAAGPSRSSTQFTMRREDAGGAHAIAARGRARAGDCAGALGAFDAAIAKTPDPALRRDRGLCHEKLGNPFPAIDDYRAYLTAEPDAPDAERIRGQLAALEEQTGGGVKASDAGTEPTAGGEASVSASAKSARFSANASASTSAKDSSRASSRYGVTPNDDSLTYDQRVAREQAIDEAESSPLRNGSGVVLGPALYMPRFFFGERARSALSYGVALALRYSTGPRFSVISEIGYAGIGTSGASSSQAGPLLFAGVELRIPATKFATDHFLVRGGVGYERYLTSGTRAVRDTVLGRFALGFRHVFGPSFAIEFLADGGPLVVLPESGSSRINGVIGASCALLVGF